MFIIRTGKHIDGSWFYQTEEGQEMTRQQFIELQSAIPGEVQKKPLTPDEQEKLYKTELLNQRLDELGENLTDKSLEIAEIESTNDARKLMGYEPIQHATPTSKQRMAGQRAELRPILFGSRDLEALQRPWELTQPNSGSPDFVGFSEDIWRMRNDETIEDLRRMKFGDKARFSEMDEWLRDERGFGQPAERERVINTLTRNQHTDAGRFLRTELYGVPQAYADEELSMAVLKGSGFKPVQAMNEEYVTGTDISAFIGNEPFKVDAQSRIGRAPRGRPSFTMGVLMGDNGIDSNKWEQLLKSNPDTSLLKLIEDERKTRSLRGDKLLHTNDANWNVVNPNTFDMRRQKDFIITSGRPNTGRFDRVGRMKRGPFNRELPEDWQMIDMQKARENLLTKSYNELQSKNIRVFASGGGLKLGIPAQYISDSLTNMDIPLDPRVVKQLTRNRR